MLPLLSKNRLKYINLHTVFLFEFLNTASRVQYFLFACIKRMAKGANLNIHIATMRRARFKLVATATGNVDFWVVRMNFSFHAFLSKFKQLQ